MKKKGFNPSEVSDGRVIQKDAWKSKEEYLLFLQHLFRYNYVKPYIKNKIILDIGCGTGYGTNFLSKYASKILGVDISENAIKFCQSIYSGKNLNFIHIDDIYLPFNESTFDVCISFEVIEHIDPKRVDYWLSEIKRILKKDGIFICSTPNKNIRLLPFQKPINPYHLKEYDYKEFEKILQRTFPFVETYGLFGNDETQYIEEQRVKQNPINVYIIKPLKIFLRFIPNTIISRFRLFICLKQEKEHKIFSELDKYSINDFYISADHLKRSLNLIGIAFCSHKK